MRRVPAYCVRGEIRDTNGRLVPNVVVSLEADFLSAGVINQGGRFLLTHLPAGSYTVVVSDRPRPGLVLARPAIRLAAGDITRLVITVPSPAR